MASAEDGRDAARLRARSRIERPGTGRHPCRSSPSSRFADPLLAPITLLGLTALSVDNVDEALGAVLYGGASHQVGALNVTRLPRPDGIQESGTCLYRGGNGNTCPVGA